MTKCGHYLNTVSCCSFIKMHGLGNDYVYIDAFQPDNAKCLAKTDLTAMAQRVSDRHFGIGSDGLVLILPSEKADARMRIFNADGSEAQMCGNAIRCVGKYLYESGICRKQELKIDTLAGVRELSLHISGDTVEQVTVNMGKPIIRPETLNIGEERINYTFVDIGNPHAVFFCDDTLQLPTDVNVEFVRVRNEQELDMRVIERGSGETMACGTGACAATAAAIRQGKTQRKVTVHLRGGDLTIEWPTDDMPIYMTGTATEVFRGKYRITDDE